MTMTLIVPIPQSIRRLFSFSKRKSCGLKSGQSQGAVESVVNHGVGVEEEIVK
jgi:hypothetical protein